MTLFCISAGQLTTKKSDNPIHRQNRYLNYGLLSLTSILKRNGIDAYQIQGNFESPTNILQTALAKGILDSDYPLLLSIPSFYAISWANEFLAQLKALRPNMFVILGGRWVIDGQTASMKALVPLADLIVPGLAEQQIVGLISQLRGLSNAIPIASVSKHSYLDYTLLHDRSLYQPSLEVSRGCGMKCSFCQEKDEPLSDLKNGHTISHEAASILRSDHMAKMNLYFEASIFHPTKPWLQTLISNRQSMAQDYLWRTETRVDSINPKDIPLLRKAGLKVLDLGLESADPTQLRNMQKTKDPERYLAKASSLIKAAHDAGIHLKVNVLLFAGETNQSIENTVNWLEQHRSMITGLSVGPVIAFGWPNKVKSYLTELSHFGASPSHDAVLGATHLNLSPEVDYEKSIEISKILGKRFTSAKNYYLLKSFSYFSRDYKYSDFLSDCTGIENELNFEVTDSCRAHGLG